MCGTSLLQSLQARVNKGAKGSVFDRVVNQLGTTGGAAASSTAAAVFSRFGNLAGSIDRSQPKAEAEEPLRDEDGQVAVQVAERMLKWHADTIGRCVELTPSSDVYVVCRHLLKALLKCDSQAKARLRAAQSTVGSYRDRVH